MSDDKIHVHLDFAEKREGLPEFQQDMPCPTCGGEPETGFGLAGGGFGVYSYCPSCGEVLTKSVTDDA